LKITNSSVKILFVPDTIWGNSSGHRSAQKVVKVLSNLSYTLGIFAPDTSNINLKKEISNCNYQFYSRTPFRYYNIAINFKAKKEFKLVLDDFQPDFLFFFGTTGFNSLAEVCLEKKIKYFLQFLTTDYYCSQNFAGLENGPCFKCIKGNYFNAFFNKCSSSSPFFLNLVKETAIRATNRKFILNADKVLGYSNDQLNDYTKFGIKKEKLDITPFFFDSSHLVNINSSLGNYFLVSGQNSVAKGWHKLSEIIDNCPNIKFKFLFPTKSKAIESLDKYNLYNFYKSGQISIKTNINKHSDLLKIIANARGVLVPSYYATTGEFFLLESLGLGKVVLCFNSGVHKEIIFNEKNGMICEINDTKKFAENIIKINNDDELCNKISQQALILFEDLMSENKFAPALNRIFKN
jgi:glycosyltransferase involved in cell wall biosynthesis